jgi:regulatory protein
LAAQPPLSLKARALRWLAQREHSRAELRGKLLRAARTRQAVPRADDAGGIADEAESPDPGREVDALLDWLAANRHLSETRFVESRVHARASRFGVQRIAHELAQHGAALDAASAEHLRATEYERARAVWLRKFGAAPAADAASRARQMRFLSGRGFSADVIRRLVSGRQRA